MSDSTDAISINSSISISSNTLNFWKTKQRPVETQAPSALALWLQSWAATSRSGSRIHAAGQKTRGEKRKRGRFLETRERVPEMYALFSGSTTRQPHPAESGVRLHLETIPPQGPWGHVRERRGRAPAIALTFKITNKKSWGTQP